MISVQALIETARTFLGVPYRHQGRSREAVDCLGLFVACGKELGIPIIDDLTYTMKVNPEHLRAGLDQHAIQDQKPVIEPGRLALMSFSSSLGSTHTVLLTDKGMLHAYNKRNQVVEHRLNDVWKKKIKKTYQINGVDYG